LVHFPSPAGAAEAPVRNFHDLAVALVALALLLGWDASGLDLVVTRWFGTPAGFPWRDHWLTSQVFHGGGRALGWLVLITLAVNVWRPVVDGLSRRQRWRWLAVTLLCMLAVPALKRISATSCPWDLAEFGGIAAYVSHWRFGVGDGGPGHCFPSGHAVSAFGFLCGWFELRHRHLRLARTWLAVTVVIGLLYGTAQLARGAHHVSHTLWTAWLCWAICTAVYAVADRYGRPRSATGGN
jgi:membrane-associated PAP2 superfamily phosphatase